MKTIYLKDGTSILDVFEIKFSPGNLWIFSHTASGAITIDINEIDRIV